MTPIDNDQDMIDSREILDRIDFLKQLADDNEITEAETQELHALVALDKEGRDYAPDWNYGEALIRDSYFVEYAKELAEDCGYGAFPSDQRSYVQRDEWPFRHIDWKAAADELKQDYTPVNFRGETYWVRS